MRVLTINSHQPYIHDMAHISGIDLYVIDQLPGRERDKWNAGVRPLPSNVRLISLEQVLQQPPDCDVFVAHNLTDLGATKTLNMPRVLLIHSSLERLLATQSTTYSRDDIYRVLQTYVQLKQVVVASVSAMKAASWGITDCPIVPFFIDTDFFHGYHGSDSRGLRVANHLVEKGVALNLEFFTTLIEGFDVQIVGDNPHLNTTPAQSQDELREFYQTCRFYVHTAAEGMEDGYNMASLEAMATGMPVICNPHPTAPIIDGQNGFISEDIELLQKKMRLLETGRDLASKLGAAARRYVVTNHSLAMFVSKWGEIFDLAIKGFEGGADQSIQ
jgi:glycosyltransferase involved in cell wall biosynthesis